MSFKLKFLITIISLIIIVFLGINILSKGERYETVLTFNNNINNYKPQDYFKVRGKVNYAQDVSLDSMLYLDSMQSTAVFNLYDSKEINDKKFIKVLYLENPKAELFGPAIIDKEVLISGYFLKDTIVQYDNKDLHLKNLLVSHKMQTQCESKYEDKKELNTYSESSSAFDSSNSIRPGNPGAARKERSAYQRAKHEAIKPAGHPTRTLTST